MSTIIEGIERRQLRNVPRFGAGDRVRVHFQVVEGTRKRTQVFEGIVIGRQGSGSRETFVVRKQSFGVGVERIFPVHSPKIEKLEIVARGDVRRAKLYYLRGRVGKRARVAERRWGIQDDLVLATEEAAPLDSEGVAQEDAEEVEPEPEDAATDDAEGGEGETTPAGEAPDAGEAEPQAAPDEGGEAEPQAGDEGEEAEPQAAPDEAEVAEPQAGGEEAGGEEPAEEEAGEPAASEGPAESEGDPPADSEEQS